MHYPVECITSKGNVSGANAVSALVKELESNHENILSDSDFLEKYPDTDIETFRVKA